MITPPRPVDVNYDENEVPPYALPDPLRDADGTRITSARRWFDERRPELLAIFASQVYGRASRTLAVAITSRRVEPRALRGLATLHEIEVRVASPLPEAQRSALSFDVALWLPNQVVSAAPAFIGLNFVGNQSVSRDPSIRLARGWVPNRFESGIRDFVATEASRGCESGRWPLELIVGRGYAVATTYAGDFDPDYDDGFQNGAHGLFLRPGARPAADEWGSIGAWAWGMRHMLDVLSLEPRIDAQRVVVTGHSRFGKAALWAAALDERFAMAIANNSGRGGAALSRRRFGELTRDLNRRFPHWFCQNFRRYDGREHELPVDQHALLALLAPRPAYVASASLDGWADPRGEYLACLGADPVFRLLGCDGVAGAGPEAPLGVSVGGTLGYHLRAGGHDITAEDWRHFLNFADRHLPAR